MESSPLTRTIQFTARINTTLLLPPVPAGMLATPPTSCTIPAIPGDSNSHPVTFGSSALGRLHRREEWLNDECIDFCSEVLRRYSEAAGFRIKTAIFSVFTISQYLGGHDEGLWRISLLTPEFWKKTIWIIPINRDHCHWTLAIVYWNKRRIAYFDSFGSKSAWEKDSAVICHLSSISLDESSDPFPLARFRSSASLASLCNRAWEGAGGQPRRRLGLISSGRESIWFMIVPLTCCNSCLGTSFAG